MSVITVLPSKKHFDTRRLDRKSYVAFYDVALDPRFLRYPHYHHLDNVSIALIHDTARIRFFSFFDNLPAEKCLDGRLIASIKLTYLAEVSRDAPFSVGCVIANIGHSSFNVNQALFVDDACVGLCDVVMVNATNKGTFPLRQGLRALLHSLSAEGKNA
jgi:acyl-CoA thioester hydrolase